MKKVIPFEKKVTFKTMLREITDIEIKHTLELNNNREVEGNILIDGKYKMTEASSLEEEFHYKFPFMIAIDNKYNLDDLNISISDFHYEIINEEELKLDVEIELDGIEIKEEKEEPIKRNIDDYEEIEDNIINETEEQEKIPDKKEENIDILFNQNNDSEEQYSTYYVYIVTENDTLEKILEKYKITKEELENYNDLSIIKAGTKLIIPCSND